MQTVTSPFISPDPITALRSGEAELTPSDGPARRRARELFCVPSSSYPSLAQLELLYASAPGFGGWDDVRNDHSLQRSPRRTSTASATDSSSIH
ncbi:MAG: hypothetical protein VX498_13440 [Myxococcota bacterium]|nr:hypothetical protein [Myxococcota bacterium]